MSDCGCIYVDSCDSSAVCYTEKMRVAKKTHKCGECDRQIQPGETYEYVSGMWEDRWNVYKTCKDCLSVREEFFCEGFYYEMIWEYAGNHIADLDGKISSDCLVNLTPRARAMVCNLIEEVWTELDEGEEY